MAIVIVDDSPTNLVVLKSLSSRIHEGGAMAFVEPEAAASYLEQTAADLVVVDYEMPGLNGVEFIRRVRASVPNKATPIVMVTHSSDRSVRVRAIEAGATAFLNKPVDALEFKTRVADLLAAAKR